jgi:hypothetical protein
MSRSGPWDQAKALSSRISASIETLLRKSLSVASVRKASFETARPQVSQTQQSLGLRPSTHSSRGRRSCRGRRASDTGLLRPRRRRERSSKWSVGVEGDLQPTRDRRAKASARARQVQMEGPGLTPWTTPSEGMPSVRMPSRSWRWLAAMSSAVVLYRAACLREDGLLGWARRYDSESSARAEREQGGGGRTDTSALLRSNLRREVTDRAILRPNRTRRERGMTRRSS